MLAGHRNLDNLIVIVDNNGLQIDGNIADVNSPYPIDKKFEAFNFEVILLEDGHDFAQIAEAVNKAKEQVRPNQIVLFSPASASFDMFKNFEERGNKFKELVNGL